MKKIPEIENPRKLEYYVSKYPELTLAEQKEKLRYFKRSCNWRNIEYYERYYPDLSHEEYLKMIEEKKQLAKENSPLQLVYWQNKFPNLSEQEQKEKFKHYKKSKCKFDIIYWQEKFPNLSSHDFNGKGYLYDFNYKNKIIEFNGDFWHANPNIYDSEWINPVTHKTAKHKWDYDKHKAECAINNGYQIIYVWESEYKENPKKQLINVLIF